MPIRSSLIAGLAILLATTAALTANAAQVRYEPSTDNNVAGIFVSGAFVEGDAARFDKLVKIIPEKTAVVFLTGPGGVLIEGLSIGETIRSRKFSTGIVGTCASACSLVWLAGADRFANNGSRVGFHAAYTGDAADARESGVANAMIGAYLTTLGLSYAAVIYVTVAPPDGITWLTAIDAKRVGIEYTFVPPTTPTPASPSVATVDSPSRQVGADAAKRAELNERLNISEGSLRKEIGNKRVDALIADFNAAAAKDPSLGLKLSVQRDPYRWALMQMAELHRLNIASSSPKDLVEAAAALTPSYAQGRQARIDYEQWFIGLPAGQYLNGAAFWASNRSLKLQPTCTNQAQPAWQSGCVDSRARLAPADRRRNTEPNFWWGWNSL